MKPVDLVDRRWEIRKRAGGRWKDQAGSFAEAAARLAKGGPGTAASPERIARFEMRERLKRTLPFHGVGLERIIGDTVDLEDVAPTLAARRAGTPVARIVELLDSNRIGEGFATGFLVGPRLLFTNWHVFGSENEALGCGAQFGYERNENGLIEPGIVFELDPEWFFYADRALDIAIVGVKPTAAIGAGTTSTYGRVRLIPTLGKILVGHPVSIVQHPDGRHKHWCVRQNKLLKEPAEDEVFLTYATDTLEGASGAPGFNHDWELVAVHHSGVPRLIGNEIATRTGGIWRPEMPDTDIDWVANEGARVSKIHAHLNAVKMKDPARQERLNALLRDASDPVLDRNLESVGRSYEALENERSGNAAMNVVINGTANFYLGSEQRTAAAEPVRIADPVRESSPARLNGQEKKLRFDPDYAARRGYDPDFLPGFTVPQPTAPNGEILKEDGRALVLDYHHYSLAMHKDRRLVIWAASNVDYHPDKRRKSRKDFGTDTWKPDPRIPIAAQIEDVEFYEPARKFDRGHIVRRDDVAWGSTELEEEFGNSDSFHWTNCTPQHEGFNRDMFEYEGLWGGLENHLATQAGLVENKLIVFAGPVLNDDDPERDFGSGSEVQVPIQYWKVIVAVEDADAEPTLRAYGFLLDQTDAIEQYGWEGRFRAGKFAEYQVPLAEITTRSRVEFDVLLRNADPLRGGPGPESRRRPLATFDALKLR